MRSSTVLLLLLAVGLSGCTDSDADSDAEELDCLNVDRDLPPCRVFHPKEAVGIDRWLYMVNETTVPGEATLVGRPYLPESRSCGVPGLAPMHVRIWNRVGYVDTHVIHFETLNETRNKTVSLPEPGPWLFATDPGHCNQHSARLHGIWEGTFLSTVEGWWIDGVELWESWRVNVTVPAGETQARMNWTPSPRFFSWEHSYTENISSRDASGTIELRYPDGRLIHRERDGLLGYQSENLLMRWLVDGQYTLEVELDYPMPQPVTWTYMFYSQSLNKSLCPYGFEWKGFCD